MRKYFFIVGMLSPLIASGQLSFAGGTGAGAGARASELSAGRARKFTLEQAILTALQQNPDILRAKQEIERTRGVILEIGAQALPHVNPSANLSWTDPNLAGRVSGATAISTSPSLSGSTAA